MRSPNVRKRDIQSTGTVLLLFLVTMAVNKDMAAPYTAYVMAIEL
jgi:hypothetical protein